jgi:hypothetical protein
MFRHVVELVVVALTIQLSLLEEDAGDPGSVLQMTGGLRGGLQAAPTAWRRLAAVCVSSPSVGTAP